MTAYREKNYQTGLLREKKRGFGPLQCTMTHSPLCRLVVWINQWQGGLGSAVAVH